MSGWVGLGIVALLIGANALFVAAEFSLVAVRRHAVEELAAAGDRRAGLVARERADVTFALSAAQFGITATSLLVGYLAERAVGDTLIRPVLDLVGLPEQAALGLAVTGAFVLSTLVQMLLGELFPKNLAISRPLAVARAVAPFSRGFGIVLGPVIRIFDGAAKVVTERVFRVPVARELEVGHSLDELARIAAASAEEGSLSQAQTDLLGRVAALGDRRVVEVMVPRPDVVWLAAEDTLADLVEVARRTGHSRFPVRGASEDDVLGSVHVKDLLAVPPDARGATPVTAIASTTLAVPESEPLRQLLGDLRRERRTFALVVDEFGGTAGIVTVEDVLEQLVGEIEDEFDDREVPVRRAGRDRFLVRGSLRLEQLERLVGSDLPPGEYETVAGFVLDRLGRIPDPGDAITHGGLSLTVTEVEGVRITEVAVERQAGGEGRP